MTQIKERPILFSAPMVRAILEGRKTVTRRVVKGDQIPRLCKGGGERPWVAVGQHGRRYGFVVSASTEDECAAQLGAFGACPYGRRGDRLWVRETTEIDEQTGDGVVLSRYSADGEPVLYSGSNAPEYDGTVAHWDYPRRSRPSIHMPRWASRILLEITDVRVERLQDISPEQVTAEGVGTRGEAMWGSRWWVDAPDQAIEDARMDFADLWSSINGAESWKANPWVWVVEFKRVQP
ncbi:hypothetical protein [Pseudomonas uvaldensis]|uniref:hypothetical protein n=1 Tax=Pseudomonas uvaldensis TaxID=2878385 RepID=UPI001E576D6F|nr:hypothetical protein [Pseudomonas uvaldensis]MCE0464848.1 hypothetical protein [Pseudomonas uvaldensis]